MTKSRTNVHKSTPEFVEQVACQPFLRRCFCLVVSALCEEMIWEGRSFDIPYVRSSVRVFIGLVKYTSQPYFLTAFLPIARTYAGDRFRRFARSVCIRVNSRPFAV